MKRTVNFKPCFFSGIKTDQRGFALLNTLIFLILMGMMAISMVTIVLADKKIHAFNLNDRQAFYAAQSGIEYAMRAVSVHAAGMNSNSATITSLHGHTETLILGNGAACDIQLNFTGTTQFEILATGSTENRTKRLRKTVNYIDVATYGIYVAGSASLISTSPSGKILQSAAFMPRFDLDVLRDLARPAHYYSGNLTVNSVFAISRDVVFAEGDITFGTFNWINNGNWVAGDDMTINSNFLPLGVTNGTMYLPNPGGNFLCKFQILGRYLIGGLIANGNAVGSSVAFWPFRFLVIYDRENINDLLQHSVNGGPIIYTGSTWEMIN